MFEKQKKWIKEHKMILTAGGLSVIGVTAFWLGKGKKDDRNLMVLEFPKSGKLDDSNFRNDKLDLVVFDGGDVLVSALIPDEKKNVLCEKIADIARELGDQEPYIKES